jgi:hypothetical protein
MQRLKTKDPTLYRLDAEGMEHLDALIKLLERSRAGMSAEEVRRTAESLKRLRERLTATATRAAVG